MGAAAAVDGHPGIRGGDVDIVGAAGGIKGVDRAHPGGAAEPREVEDVAAVVGAVDGKIVAFEGLDALIGRAG
ncbi:hypothetical protein MICAG_110003 [Microcystis aeruginosa PCC 9808]|uniref:Uncharacterized protein n=1 Tax=Microcystis aeruginosa PCC 9808 TaxID=1160284 RepID=I4HFM1_MICAE|nr:hypothetical protein MICAG_110003 [Microcystis aeruginosa PCC 9808]